MRLSGLSFWIFLLSNITFATLHADEASQNVEDTIRVSQLGGQLEGFTPLMAGEQQVPALYLEQKLGEPRGAILLLHDLGENMDSSTLSVLRTGLPASGWDTLSVALNYPILDADTPPPTADIIEDDDNALPAAEEETEVTETDADTAMKTTDVAEQRVAVTNAQRIDAALAFLQAQGAQRIILLGHGQAGELALATVPATAIPIAAVVMLGTGQLKTPRLLTEANLPILELYGSRHDQQVIKAIQKRQVTMKMQVTQPYDVRHIEAADRAFMGTHRKLVKTVHSWLHRQLIEGPAN